MSELDPSRKRTSAQPDNQGPRHRSPAKLLHDGMKRRVKMLALSIESSLFTVPDRCQQLCWQCLEYCPRQHCTLIARAQESVLSIASTKLLWTSHRSLL
jgi:hypothetical protein